MIPAVLSHWGSEDNLGSLPSPVRIDCLCDHVGLSVSHILCSAWSVFSIMEVLRPETSSVAVTALARATALPVDISKCLWCVSNLSIFVVNSYENQVLRSIVVVMF